MTTYRTPDVYIEEISVFPPSVAEVGTAIPAFIGYTEKITRLQHQDLLLKPTLITSFAEFEELFGRPHDPEISVQVTTLQPDGKDGKVVGYEATVTPPVTTYALYYAVRMFFDNGGARCYVVSTGVYGEKPGLDLIKGIEVIQLEDEPTLIVVPDAVYLTESDYTTIVETVLKQCGLLRERFGIFDIQMGDLTRLKPDHPLRGASLTTVRGHFPMQNLKYGAAYYPYLKTSFNHYIREDETNVKVTLDSVSGELAKLKSPPDVSAGAEANAIDAAKQRLGAYNFVKAELKKYFVIVPPSGAVAGVYASTDATRGVWKAPANVSIAGVIEPLVKVDNLGQEDFNVDPNSGKSINVIRAFAGKGTLVWGARTLAGNDNEWRYINVRRFFNMVEESIKKSTYWAVFEPNDANTWIKLRGMIENYLTDKWREGALAGATPKDAFFVKCGLGSTMTPQDILNGYLHIEIGMAVVRPAEFVVLKFSHKLQTS